MKIWLLQHCPWMTWISAMSLVFSVRLVLVIYSSKNLGCFCCQSRRECMLCFMHMLAMRGAWGITSNPLPPKKWCNLTLLLFCCSLLCPIRGSIKWGVHYHEISASSSFFMHSLAVMKCLKLSTGPINAMPAVLFFLPGGVRRTSTTTDRYRLLLLL